MSWKTSTWPSQPAPAPMPIVGIVSALRDPLGDGGGHALEHQGEGAGLLDGDRVVVQLDAGVGGPALGLPAAERRRRLRRQAEVAHHRDPAPASARIRSSIGAGALELDGVGAGLLEEAGRRCAPRPRPTPGSDRTAGRRPPAAGGAAGHGRVSITISSIVDRHGRGVAEHGHRRRVADQHEVDAGVVGDPARRVVVGGHHHDRLAVALELGQLGQAQLPGRGRAGGGGAGAGADQCSRSRSGAEPG